MENLKGWLTILLLCSMQWGQAQIKFFRTYTNNGYDYGEGVTQLADSGYIVTGSSSSFEDAPAQAFLMRTDSLGNFMWSHAYGGSESDWGRRVFAVENDGIYVTGYTNSYGAGAYDFYCFKTDWSGNYMLWEKTVGESGWERLWDAAMLPDTWFLLVGETTSTENGVEDIFVARMDKHGDTLWTRKIGSAGSDIARSVKILNDTTVVIAGEYYVADSLTQKAMLLSMDTDGTVNWLKTYGANGKYVFNDLYIDNDEIRAVGYMQVLNPYTLPQEYRLMADAAGVDFMQESTPKPGSFRIGKLTKYGAQGKYYIVNEAMDVPDIPTYAGGDDIVIVRYNNNLGWDQAFYNPSSLGQDQANQIIPTSDGGAVMVGYNSNSGAGGSNVTLVKLGANDNFPASIFPVESALVGIGEILADGTIKAYPNPAMTTLELSSEIAGKKQVTVYDAFGKQVLNASFESELSLNVESWSQGVYIVQVQAGIGVATMRIVKQ